MNMNILFRELHLVRPNRNSSWCHGAQIRPKLRRRWFIHRASTLWRSLWLVWPNSSRPPTNLKRPRKLLKKSFVPQIAPKLIRFFSFRDLDYRRCKVLLLPWWSIVQVLIFLLDNFSPFAVFLFVVFFFIWIPHDWSLNFSFREREDWLILVTFGDEVCCTIFYNIDNMFSIFMPFRRERKKCLCLANFHCFFTQIK